MHKLKAEKLEWDLKILQGEMYHITRYSHRLWLIITRNGNERPEMIIIYHYFPNFLNS